MNVDLGIWQKLTWAVIVLGLVAGLAFVVELYLPLIRQNERLRINIAKLNDQIREEEAEALKLRAYIDGVNHDPAMVERLARERLGYARPGETVVRFEEPAGTNTPR
jgi:cell division protein FtsB